MTEKLAAQRATLIEILDGLLPEPLPRPWPDEQPLTQAGLDSVGVVTLVGELELRFGLTIGEEEMTEAHFSTLAGLLALVDSRSAGS